MSERILVVQSEGNDGHIVYRARGISAPDRAALAKLLGVSEDLFDLSVDRELYEAAQRLKRRRGPRERARGMDDCLKQF